MGQGDTLFNALAGAAVTVFASFIPFSPVFGGGLAAYLQEGDKASSIRIGAISGAFAAVPFVLFALFVVAGLGFVAPAAGLFGLVILFVFVVAGLYTVGLSTLGGFLGWYVREETTLDDELRDAL